MQCSNLTNKYNPQERHSRACRHEDGSNLTNKYNPQEPIRQLTKEWCGSNLTNKYNPQEQIKCVYLQLFVQILPINTILKNSKRRFGFGN